MSLAESHEVARAFAMAAHGDQQYGNQPYVVHLEAVHSVAEEFEIADEAILLATWLHDVEEDTEVTNAHLRDQFGEDVAALVHAVTNAPGSNRKERTKATYPKIAATPGAVKLKLADRIANVRACLENNRGLLKMYQREYRKFRIALMVEGRDATEEAMWVELDRLMGWRRR